VNPTSILYSYDGLTWLTSPSTISTTLNTVAWNGSYWLAAGNDNTNNDLTTIYRSADGINWISSASIPFSVFSSVAWNGSYWLACVHMVSAQTVFAVSTYG
jgi:hypothetical protein